MDCVYSEGDVNASPQINSFVNQATLTGQQLQELAVLKSFATTGNSGIQ